MEVETIRLRDFKGHEVSKSNYLRGRFYCRICRAIYSKRELIAAERLREQRSERMREMRSNKVEVKS